jgi:hypothetical protein
MRIAPLAGTRAANRYGWVIVLIIVSYVTSVNADGALGITVVMLFQLVTLWLVFSASESYRAQRLVGIACVLVGLGVVAAAVFGHVLDVDSTAERTISIFSAVAYMIAPLVIIRHLIRRQVVDLRTVLGAVAIYLLLGMAFAFTFRTIALNGGGGAFFGETGEGTNANFLFFSFITLTTTGYGNLVPAGNPGQSLAVLEAIIGQLFLVTALAKIVSAWRMPGPATSPPPTPPA